MFFPQILRLQIKFTQKSCSQVWVPLDSVLPLPDSFPWKLLGSCIPFIFLSGKQGQLFSTLVARPGHYKDQRNNIWKKYFQAERNRVGLLIFPLTCSKITPGALRSSANYLGPANTGWKVVICSASCHLWVGRPPSLLEEQVWGLRQRASWARLLANPRHWVIASGCRWWTVGAKGRMTPNLPLLGKGGTGHQLNLWEQWTRHQSLPDTGRHPVALVAAGIWEGLYRII